MIDLSALEPFAIAFLVVGVVAAVVAAATLVAVAAEVRRVARPALAVVTAEPAATAGRAA